jgi:hypothetical protein
MIMKNNQVNMAYGDLTVAVVMLVLVSNIAVCDDYAWIVDPCAMSALVCNLVELGEMHRAPVFVLIEG